MKAMAKMTLPRDYIASFTGEFNSNLYFALLLDLSSAILYVQVLHNPNLASKILGHVLRI